MSGAPIVYLVGVERVRDATHLWCEDCDRCIHDPLRPVPWGLRNTKWMHERGAGHSVRYMRAATLAVDQEGD